MAPLAPVRASRCRAPLSYLGLAAGRGSEPGRLVEEEEKGMRSDAVKTGVYRAPHRSLLRALGYTQWELEQPFVGVVNWPLRSFVSFNWKSAPAEK